MQSLSDLLASLPDTDGDARKAALIAQLTCSDGNPCARENLLLDTYVQAADRWFVASCTKCGKSVSDIAADPSPSTL